MKNANPPIPPAWKKGRLSYGAGLTLSTAKKMLEAAEKEAEQQGVPMSIAIVDAGGNLLAFYRMDSAILFSIQIAMDKAFTAVFGKRSTQDIFNRYQRGTLPIPFTHERQATLPGGFPIISDGVLLGGIGASGGAGLEDTSVGRAALIAGGFSREDADAAVAEWEIPKRKLNRRLSKLSRRTLSYFKPLLTSFIGFIIASCLFR